MSKLSNQQLLKDIQSDDIEQAFMRLTNKACEWAVAGYLLEANKLLQAQWSYEQEHSGHLWLPDEGFQIMWEVSKLMPSAKIPFKFKNIEDIENENWRRICPAWTEAGRIGRSLKTLKGLNGHELFAKAITAMEDKTETVSDILKALGKFINSEDAVGYSYFQATSCASVFAARNSFEKEALEFIELWGNGYSKYWNNYSLSYLMRDRATTRLLLKGTLSKVFKLTTEICRNELAEISFALSERFTKGRTLVYGSLSWKQLLKTISVKAIEQKTIDFSEEIIKSQWMGKTPATLPEIVQSQKKLGITYPNDYIEFLLASNGFNSISNIDITISPIDKVDLLINVDEDLVNIWTNAMGDVDEQFTTSFTKSIIIGGYREEQKLLLIPLENNQWECWHFANSTPGETKYPSLRFYMEEVLQRLDNDFYMD